MKSETQYKWLRVLLVVDWLLDKLVMPLFYLYNAISGTRIAILILTHSPEILSANPWAQSMWFVAALLVFSLFFTIAACSKWNYFLSKSKS